MRFTIALIFFFSISQIGTSQKTVLLEKFTNSRCGVCPNATLNIKEIVENHPNTIWISHYKPFDGSPLNNDQSNQLWFDFNLFGVPSILVDRRYDNGLFPSSSQWENVVAAKLQEEQSLDLKISNLLTNTVSRTFEFDLDIDFITTPSAGEYRVSYILVEDWVYGEPQSSYYNDVEGHPLFGLGNLIWDYAHRNVVRQIVDDAWGSPLDDLINPTESTSITAGMKIPISEDYKIENMAIVCVVSKYNPNNIQDIEVLQAVKMNLSEGSMTSSEDLDNDPSIELYPNPSNGEFMIKAKNKIEELAIFNATGILMTTFKDVENQEQINLSNLPEGIYTAQFRIENKTTVKKISILR